MLINKSIYVNVAGAGIFCSTKGAVCLGGYNGGGNGHAAAYAWSGATSANPTSGGGGATHIATISGQLRNLSAYKDSGGTNVSNEILIVAGGGGGYGECNYVGGCTNNLLYAYGGVGGGIYGGSGRCIVAATGQPYSSWDGYYGGTGANQTSPGTSQNGGSVPRTGGFGYGGTGADTCDNGNCGDNGGGAGWFGGGGTVRGHNGGGGGSGYIGSSNLISGGGVTKHMTCYSCTTSSVAATRTYSNTTTPTSTPTADVARIGNGYAKITYLGPTV